MTKQVIETDSIRVVVKKLKATCRIPDPETAVVKNHQYQIKRENTDRSCEKNYYKTKLMEDWLECVLCKLWKKEKK